MIKKINYLLLLLFCFPAYAQQLPHYTQYILNNYVLNPALTGIENYTDIKLSARDQWVGLDGAPKTFYLTVHGPIGKKDYKSTATSFHTPGENPRGKSYWENYQPSQPHHGIGLSVINDKTGNYNHLFVNASYAYHVGLSSGTNIAAGFSAGISKLSYDRSKATPVDPNDPSIGNVNTILTKVQPDINVGIWLYSADYFFGISVQQIISKKVAFVNQQEGFKIIPHFFTTAGYRFLLDDDINMIPSIMAKYVKGSPTVPQFDINIKLQYQDLIWVGASYRLQDGYAAMTGLNIGNTFNVGYSYDFTKTIINTTSHGTHEIILGFLIGNHYGDTCPRNIW